MKLPLIILILSSMVFAQDIPDVGSSVFDKLFYQKDKGVYQIPYPISKLVDAVALKAGTSDISHSYFPFSRSLQRPIDLSYNPIKKPRIVFAAGVTENPFISNRLFWAYVEPKDQIEVISYNEEAGRFEFQVIKDYSTSPKVFYAQRAKCLSCHQNQAPILSVAPWSDSASLNGNNMRVAVLRAYGLEPKFDRPPNKKLDEYIIGTTSNSHDQIVNLDSRVRTADGIVKFQKLYTTYCSDNKCRLEMVLKALGLCSVLSNISSEYCKLDNYSDIVKKTKNSNEVWASSFLSQNVPYQDKVLRNLGFEIYGNDTNQFFAPQKAAAHLFKYDQYILEIIDSLKKLPNSENPASSRLKKIFASPENITLGISSTRFLNSIHPWKKSGKYQDVREIVKNELIKMYQNGSHIFDAKPLNLNELASAIRIQLNNDNQRDIAFPLLNAKDYATLLKESTIPIFSNSSLNLFAKHCSSCHQTGEGYPNQFLSGNEEQVAKQIRQIRDLISRRLREREMPPTEELQQQLMKSNDIEQMLEYLVKESF